MKLRTIDMIGADHAIIMKYDEGDLEQVQIPPKTLYHRWNAELTFDRVKKGKVYLKNVDITVSAVAAPIFPDAFSLTHLQYQEFTGRHNMQLQ